MYTVKELSVKLNISKQAIYKKITRPSINKYISCIDGVKYISEEGFQLLKDSCINAKEIIEELNEEVIVVKQVDSIDSTGVDNRIIDILERNNLYLKEENKKLLELVEQSNKLLHTEQQLQQKVLTNTELLLVEKRKELEIREIDYNLNKKLSLKERVRILFKGK